MGRLIPFLLLLGVLDVSGEDNLRPIIGLINKDGAPRYSISMFDFGIEHWEGSKKSETQRQLWHLSCEHPPYFGQGQDTHCSLERTTMLHWDQTYFKTVITIHKHDSDDGTLEIQKADWERGILKFAIVYADQTKTEVDIRMRYDGNLIYLDSFKAFAIAKGLFADSEMAIIEYKIPEYSYILDVRVRMRGFKTEGQKNLEELISLLSDKDRAIWNALKADILDFPSKEEVSQAIPDYGNRDLTPTDWAKLVKAMIGNLEKQLQRAGVSSDGQAKIVEVFAKWFRSAVP